MGVLSAFFFLVSNKTKIIYFPSGMEMVKPPEEGGSLSPQPAIFEKAAMHWQRFPRTTFEFPP